MQFSLSLIFYVGYLLQLAKSNCITEDERKYKAMRHEFGTLLHLEWRRDDSYIILHKMLTNKSSSFYVNPHIRIHEYEFSYEWVRKFDSALRAGVTVKNFCFNKYTLTKIYYRNISDHFKKLIERLKILWVTLKFLTRIITLEPKVWVTTVCSFTKFLAVALVKVTWK